MSMIWICLSSSTKCVLHILREVGAELKLAIEGVLTNFKETYLC